MECPLCLELLTTGPHTKLPHAMNGICDGFTAHTTCLIEYIHMHITQRANFVCTICNLNLAPQGRADAARLGIAAAPAAPVAVAPVAAEAALPPGYLLFERMVLLYTDLFFTFTGTHTFCNIVMTGGGSIAEYLHFGTAVIYASARSAPYLFRRNVRGGRTNRKRGGTRKDIRTYVLKPNEVAVITIRNPKEHVIRKLEQHFGKPRKIINYDDIMDRVAGQ